MPQPPDNEPADPSAERPSRYRGLKRLLAFGFGALVLMWIIGVGFLTSIQDRIIFPRDLLPPAAAKPTIARAIEVEVPTPDGPVYAWFCPAPDASREAPAPAVIFMHGNAELIEHHGDTVARYHAMGASVLLPEYRGYGRAAGNPSQAGIGDDCEAFYDWLAQEPSVDADRIVFHGRSLGGGVACELASRRPPAAMILQSTFSSIVAMANAMWAPGFLVKHKFRSDQVLADATWPTLIVHGLEDEIIPVEHSERLRDIAPDGLVTYSVYPSGHNDFPGDGNDDRYWQEVQTFLQSAAILE